MYSYTFVVLLLFSSANCDVSLLETANGNSNKIAKAAECVLALSAKYFVEKKALSGSIVIININSYTSSTQQLLLRTIHGGTKYSVMVKDSFYKHANASHFPEKAKNYMLILEEQSELIRNIKQLNKLPTWNPLAKAIVFYELKSNESGSETAIDFVNQLRSYKLYRTIVLIYSSANEDVTAYTWRPYTDMKCGGECDAVYTLDRCSKGILEEVTKQHEMFPADMKGCPLVAFAVVAEPYVMPPLTKKSDTIYKDAYVFDKGGEINLVKIISQFTNMTLLVRMSDEPENWGDVYPNGTATGAFGVLRNDSVDLVIGNIEVTRIIRKYFDPTISYNQDEMTWCVPRAGQASTWDNLVTIFQWSTWLATLITLIIMGLLFHWFYYLEKDKKVTKWPTNSLLMTLSMLLGWGAHFDPKSATFRILIFGWLCFSTNMGISYVSFLRSFLMHPRFEKQISSEADIIESRVPLGGRGVYRAYFETNSASSFYIHRKFTTTSFTDGIRRTAYDNFAVVASRRQALYMNKNLGKGTSLIYCFPESNNLYKYGVVLLARKWFPFLERFDNIIRSVSENGLIEKWSRELVSGAAVDEASSIVPLGFEHLLGAFMFIGFMYAVSVAVFLGEMIAGLVGRRRFKRSILFLH